VAQMTPRAWGIFFLERKHITMMVTKQNERRRETILARKPVVSRSSGRAVMARFGDTMVLATVVASKEVSDKI